MRAPPKRRELQTREQLRECLHGGDSPCPLKRGKTPELLGRAERVPARALSRGLATGGVAGIRWRAEGLRREAARHDDRHAHARALGRRWSGVGTRTADEKAPTNPPPRRPQPPIRVSPISLSALRSGFVCVTAICILIGYFVCTGLSRAIGVVTNVTKKKYLRTPCSLYDDMYTFT